MLAELAALEKPAQQCGQTAFQYMMQHKIISAEKFCADCVNYFNIQEAKLDNINLNTLPIDSIKIDFIKNNLLLPIEKNKSEIIIAISNPEDLKLEKAIQFQAGLKIKFVFIKYDILYRLHNLIISKIAYKNKENPAELLAHQILSDAIHQHVSDIHCEPHKSTCRIRIRIDGMLHELLQFDQLLGSTLLSCLKVLANCDIAIKRTPQDGRFTFKSNLGFIKDCRVSTYPTIYGEKIVIRLLDANTQIKKIEELGLSLKNQQIILNTIAKPQGLILVTGPTGSGKTITLYTLLNLLNKTHRNITTIEDPVEIQVEGLNQSAVNIKSQFTFSNALRALLRQDPDVMMIGEIRDQETADMCIRAAETGHLVLSTLHTNSAAEALIRLTQFGVAPFHLASALKLVIAQRLVRKLCKYCLGEKNCAQCIDGFSGRIGIFELLEINHDNKNQILNHEKIIINQTLWQAALLCVENKITSFDEIKRVIPNDSV